MKMNEQREIFLNSEGDAWFDRNKASISNGPDSVDECIFEQLLWSNSVLEIGCADGRRLSRIGSRFARPMKLVGIDPSQE